MTQTIDALVQIDERSRDELEVMEKWATEHGAEVMRLGVEADKLFDCAYEDYRKQNDVKTVLPHYKEFSEFFKANYLSKLNSDHARGKKG